MEEVHSNELITVDFLGLCTLGDGNSDYIMVFDGSEGLDMLSTMAVSRGNIYISLWWMEYW